MLFNIKTMEWDDELLSLFGIPRSMMPEVMPSSSIFGYTDAKILGAEIPIGGVAGDQQSALFGQCCFDKGDIKNTYGTGAFLLMNTGDVPHISQKGLITTVAWSIGEEVTYSPAVRLYSGYAMDCDSSNPLPTANFTHQKSRTAAA